MIITTHGGSWLSLVALGMVAASGPARGYVRMITGVDTAINTPERTPAEGRRRIHVGR